MGQPKLLLPLGGRTVLQRLLDAAFAADVKRALVVVRPDDAILSHHAASAHAEVVMLPAATPDMRATVLAGLDWIETHLAVEERKGVYLTPADHPVLDPEIFRAICAASVADKVVIPTYTGRRGHPVWIPWRHVAGLRRVPEGQGLNAYLRLQETVDVPWPNEAVLMDLDTPEDYAQLQSLVERSKTRERQ